jgi:type 1 glutamine amidotransferase
VNICWYCARVNPCRAIYPGPGRILKLRFAKVSSLEIGFLEVGFSKVHELCQFANLKEISILTIQAYPSRYITAPRWTTAVLHSRAWSSRKILQRTLLNHVSLALLLPFISLLMPQVKSQATITVHGSAPRPWDQNPDGMHIYIWAGLKSHLAGQHDYPQFLADWSKILTEHGAVVDGALHEPHAIDLEHTDVVIIYKGDAGYLSDNEKIALEAYIRRGGGLVSIHDSLCGPDPAYFATLVGGGKKHGEVNYTLGAPIPYTVVDTANPIMKGMSDITIFDEAFYNMTWAQNPSIHVLATTAIPGTPSAGTHKGEVVPQIWTYEHTPPGGQPARAFVWMQGHEYVNFNNYQVQQMLLRGIAWAAKKPIDALVDYVPQHLSRTQPSGTSP